MEAKSDFVRFSFITRILFQKPFLVVSNTPKLQVLEIQHIPEFIPIKNKDYSLAKASALDLGSSSLLFNGYLASIPGVKQVRHEVDHSTPSSAKLGMSGAIHLLPYIPSWHGVKSFYISVLLFHILDTCRLRFKSLSQVDTHTSKGSSCVDL
jgi:hypothetical protein